MAALQFESELGVVRAGHVAGRHVERLARQTIVEIETGGRAIGKPCGLVDNRDTPWRQRSLRGTVTDLFGVELDGVRTPARADARLEQQAIRRRVGPFRRRQLRVPGRDARRL